MPMTVAQIAERAARHGGSKTALIQRLRHWTRERLLLPLGEQNPGTGRHLTFADTAVLEAVILDEMTDAGVPIAAQRYIMQTVRGEAHLGLRVKEVGPRNLFLVVETYQGRLSHPYFREGTEFKINDLAERTIVFNLTKLFAATGGTNV